MVIHRHRRDEMIAGFLRANPALEFRFADYLTAFAHIEAAEERFAAFGDRLIDAGIAVNPWSAERSSIETATRNVPAYRSIDWSHEQYWHTIGVLDKSTIRSRLDRVLNPEYRPDELWLRPTSGTTGPPLDVPYAPAFFVEFQLHTVTKIALVAGRFTDEVRSRPILNIALTDNRTAADSVWAHPSNERGLTLRLGFDERDPSCVRRFSDAWRRFRPALLALKPNILARIVRDRAQLDGPVPDDLRLVVCSGARLDLDLQAAGEEVLGAPVANAYGLGEVGTVASTCVLGTALHVYPGVIVEVLVDDVVASRGTGICLVSSVANRAMPLLRYLTGDLVELTTAPCPCGVPGPRLTRIAGRVAPNMALPNGREYSPSNLKRMFAHFPLAELQVTQRAAGTIEVSVVPSPECDGAIDLDAIRDFVAAEFDHLVPVSVTAATDCGSGGSWQRFVVDADGAVDSDTRP